MPRYRLEEHNEEVKTARRIFTVGGVIAFCLGALFCRAAFFRLTNSNQLDEVALRQYKTAVRTSSLRGRILDVERRELAIDIKVKSVYANPSKLKTPVEAAQKLSDLLDVERRTLLDRFSSKRKFVWVKRRIDEDLAMRIKSLNIPGINLMDESKRQYPSGLLAGSVLGAVGYDSKPLGGIELSYNDVLAMQLSYGNLKRDARGYLYLSPTDIQSINISDIVLTIDKTLQYIVERELLKAVESSDAKDGTAIVVNVNTGEILAMASYPMFNPNHYSKYPLSHWTNRAVVNAYEPGSTFKVIVVASALDRDIITLDDEFNCENGKIQIADHIVKDTHPYGDLGVSEIIKVSSNIGTYKIENKMGRDLLYESIRAFGFGSKTSIDLPGESSGILSKPNKWSVLQYATIAFGQGIAATPLQMVMAFSAIANGGKLLKPYLVKEVVMGDDSVRTINTPTIVSYPISRHTSKTMRAILEGVVSAGGTGTLAASMEYDVAGKTGTAQKADHKVGGYAVGKYHSSFVGFAPASNPLIAVYVGLDEPSGRHYYGGQVAAPVFREITESTLHYLKVPGTLTAMSDDAIRQLPPPKPKNDVVGLWSINDADQLKVADAAQVKKKYFKKDKDGLWRIPNLTGMTMKSILSLSADMDIVWEFEGSGLAYHQDPVPGSIIPSGRICKVMFKSLL